MDDDTLRERLAVAYGTRLDGESLRWDDQREAAAVMLADRIAGLLGEPVVVAAEPGAAIGPPPWPRAPIPTGDRAAAVRDVVAWAAARGAVFDAVEIQISPAGNRTVHARRPIERQERIVFVPRDLILIDDNLDATPLGARLVPSRDRLSNQQTPFATWLAAERAQPGSPWRPYLDALPAAPDTPGFRDEADLMLLAATAARAGVLAARHSLAADHAHLVEVLGDDAPTLAALAWARAVTGSRTFKLMIDGLDCRGMVPIAEFFDHGPGDTTWSYDDSAGGLAITAARDLAAGEQIHLGYGEFANSHFVTHYGFAIDDNPDDIALLCFPPAANPLVDVAAACLWDHPLAAPIELEAGTRIEGGMRRALSLARLRVASYRELIKATDAGRFEGRELLWLGADVDRAALQLLAEAARANLARLVDPPPGDNPSAWAQTAAVIRAGERAVLAAITELPERAAPYLADPSPWPWRRAAVSIAVDSRGGEALMRSYILMIADELPR